MKKYLIAFFIILLGLAGIAAVNAQETLRVENGWSWNSSIGWTCFGGIFSANSDIPCPRRISGTDNWTLEYNEDTKEFEGNAWNDNAGWISFDNFKVKAENNKLVCYSAGTASIGKEDEIYFPKVHFDNDNNSINGEIRGYACILSLGDLISFNSESENHSASGVDYGVKVKLVENTNIVGSQEITRKDILLSGCAWSQTLGWFQIGQGDYDFKNSNTGLCRTTTYPQNDIYVYLGESINELCEPFACSNPDCRIIEPVKWLQCVGVKDIDIEIELSVSPRIFRINPNEGNKSIELKYNIKKVGGSTDLNINTLNCSLYQNDELIKEAVIDSLNKTLTRDINSTTKFQIKCVTGEKTFSSPSRVARLLPFSIGN